MNNLLKVFLGSNIMDFVFNKSMIYITFPAVASGASVNN